MAKALCIEVQFAKDLNSSEFRVLDPLMPGRQLHAYVVIMWDEFRLETPVKKVVEGRADFSTPLSFSLPRKGNTLEIKVYDKRGVQGALRGDSLIGETSLEIDLSGECRTETVSIFRGGQTQGVLSLLLRKKTITTALPAAMYSQVADVPASPSPRHGIALPASMYDIMGLLTSPAASPSSHVNGGQYYAFGEAPASPIASHKGKPVVCLPAAEDGKRHANSAIAPVMQPGSYTVMPTAVSPSAYAQAQLAASPRAHVSETYAEMSTAASPSVYARALSVASPSAYVNGGQYYAFEEAPATRSSSHKGGRMESLPAAEYGKRHAGSAIAPVVHPGSYTVMPTAASPSAYAQAQLAASPRAHVSETYAEMSTAASPSVYAQALSGVSPSAYVNGGQNYAFGEAPVTPMAFHKGGPVESLPAAENGKRHANSASAPVVHPGSYTVMPTAAFSPSAYAHADAAASPRTHVSGTYGEMPTAASSSAYAQALSVASPSAYVNSGQYYAFGDALATSPASHKGGPVESLSAAEGGKRHARSTVVPVVKPGSYTVMPTDASPSAYAQAQLAASPRAHVSGACKEILTAASPSAYAQAQPVVSPCAYANNTPYYFFGGAPATSSASRKGEPVESLPAAEARLWTRPADKACRSQAPDVLISVKATRRIGNQ